MADDIDDRDPKEMTFLDHLEESRKTIIYCIGCFFIGTFIALGFLEEIADVLAYPYREALGDGGPALQGLHGLTTTGPFGVFTVMFQISFIGGLIIALPGILLFVAKFVSPALTKKEKKIIAPICIISFLLFLTGAAFSYFLIMPASLKASMFFNKLLGFETIWTADSYYGLLMWMVFGIGLSFEFPLLLVALVYVGVFSTKQLKAFRSYSFIIFLVVSAIITPTPDPFTFLLLAGPMAILYEIAILVSVYFEKKRIKRENASDDNG
jgi:sec-independent protein translocase protein TatC